MPDFPPMNDFQTSVDFQEEIAIVGMACRLPGGVLNPDDFWNLLVNKRSGIGRVPKSRFDVDGFYSPVPKAGTLQSTEGYFLENVDLSQFDASFFSCSKKEVDRMDPLQRQLLEITWECLESAGETGWRGKNVGCYVGTMGQDWLDENVMDTHMSGGYRLAGFVDFILPNRVSYEFGFTGPSMAVKTGCSSSLVALDIAANALRKGEISSAMVIGGNIMTSPLMTVIYTDQGIISPTGKCKTFDASADGYARGEAVNALYVKRLSDALRDGNPIRGILRSSGTNHDGKKSGLLNPNSHAQEALIRQTYKAARITDFSKTAFFECHGTGTAIGDPNEVSAVARVFGESGMTITGVKPNIGHSEGAAGISSAIKAILALEHKIIPPNIYFNKPNPRIPWKSSSLVVPTDPMSWPKDRMERVSVNSFGIGNKGRLNNDQEKSINKPGSNAHIILESYKGDPKKDIPKTTCTGLRLLTFSASNAKSLQDQEQHYRDYIHKKGEALNLNDLAHTLSRHREHLDYRSFAIFSDPTAQLSPIQSQLLSNSLPKVVFVFTGQGAQWPEMSSDLMTANPVFLASIRKLNRYLAKLPHPPCFNLEEELRRDKATSQIMKSEYSLPCCTAVQIALVDVLRSLGVSPASVVGHSSGEIAAAYAVGCITAEAAIAVAYYRGRACSSSREGRPGGMAAIGLGAEEITQYLVPGVVVGCENSQNSTTISGDRARVEEVVKRIKIEREGILAKLLLTQSAFHSPHMNQLGPEYESLIAPHLQCHDSKIPFYSSVTGDIIQGVKLDASYWHRSFIQPVLFNSAVRSMFKEVKGEERTIFVEIGAHPALQAPLKQILRDVGQTKVAFVETLKRNENSVDSLLKTAGHLFCQKIDINFASIIPRGKVLTDLPTYAWLHDTSFGDQPLVAAKYKHRKFPRHDLLGSRLLEGNDVEPTWRNILDVKDSPWLAEHEIMGQIVYPAAGYIAMAGEAIRQISTEFGSYSIRDFSLSVALLLKMETKVEIQTRLRPIPNVTDRLKWYNVQIVSYDGNTWITHCTANVAAGVTATSRPTSSIHNFPRKVGRSDWYDISNSVGLEYGPAFQGLDEIYTSTTELKATATISSFEDTTDYNLHPVTIDQCFQIMTVARCQGQRRKLKKAAIPTFIEEIVINSGLGDMQIEGQVCITDSGGLFGNAILTQGESPIFIMKGFVASPLSNEKLQDDYRLVSFFKWESDTTFYKKSVDFAKITLDTCSDVSSTNAHDLQRTVELLAHKNPNLNILDIGGKTACTTAILQWLMSEFKERLYQSYTIVANSNDSLLEAQNHYKDVDSVCVTMENTLTDISGKRYDLIITTEFTLTEENLFGNMEHFRQLLSSNGKIILKEFLLVAELACIPKPFIGLNNCLNSKTGFQPHILQKRLSKMGFNLEVDGVVSDRHAKTEFSGTTISSKKICLIIPNLNHTLVDSMQKCLSNNEFDVQLSALEASLSNHRDMIVMVDFKEPYIYNMTETNFRSFLDLISNYKGSMIWVTPSVQTLNLSPDPTTAMIIGLTRTLRSEANVDITTVEVHSTTTYPYESCEAILEIFQNLSRSRGMTSGDLEQDYEYSIVDGEIKVPRQHWTTAKEELARCAYRSNEPKIVSLRIGKANHLNFPKWFSYPISDMREGHVRIDVKAVGLNERDLRKMKVKAPSSATDFGGEAAGIVKEIGHGVTHLSVGDHVIAFGNGLASTSIMLPETSCLKIGPKVPFQEAAGLADTYGSAYLALIDIGRIQEGESLLVLDACSSLGVAAIQIAKQIGATIYAVVKNTKQANFLHDTFGISLRNIVISVDGSDPPIFINEATNCVGVDFLIDVLPTDQTSKYLPCMTPSGTALIYATSSSRSNRPVLLRMGEHERIQRTVDLHHLICENPIKFRRIMQHCWEFLEKHDIRTNQRLQIFEAKNFSEAFESVSNAYEFDKVILKTPVKEDGCLFFPATYQTPLRFRSDACYLMVGGLGGLGRAVATWMVENGARSLLFLSRSARESSATLPFFNELRSQGCAVLTYAGSVDKMEDVINAIKLTTMPLAGVMQMSMVLRDNSISEMSFSEWQECIRPKVDGTWNLHKACSEFNLDFFVLFSSVSGVTGQWGQANYNAANTYLDAFVNYRQGLNLPASVIDIGVMGDIGIVADDDSLIEQFKAAGYHFLSEQDLLDGLVIAIANSRPDPSSDMNRSQVCLGFRSTKPLSDPSTRVAWKRDARMAISHNFDTPQTTPNSTSTSNSHAKDLISLATNNPSLLKDRKTINSLANYIGEALFALLMKPFDNNSLDFDTSLQAIGLDSLVAIELNQWMKQQLNLSMPVLAMLQSSSLMRLVENVAGLLYEQQVSLKHASGSLSLL